MQELRNQLVATRSLLTGKARAGTGKPWQVPEGLESCQPQVRSVVRAALGGNPAGRPHIRSPPAHLHHITLTPTPIPVPSVARRVGIVESAAMGPLPPTRTHDLQQVQSTRLVHVSPCASPGKGRGGPAGAAREKSGRTGRSPPPFPTGFSEAEKNGSRGRARKRRKGAGFPAPGEEQRVGKRRGEEVADDTQAAGKYEARDPWSGGAGRARGRCPARRLTKEGESAALSLPVRRLRAPPREPRSPAVPSGSPAPPPPPLWEATWTCRFGPLAKSRLGAKQPAPAAGPLLLAPASPRSDRLWGTPRAEARLFSAQRPAAPRDSAPRCQALSARDGAGASGEASSAGGGTRGRGCGAGERGALRGAAGAGQSGRSATGIGAAGAGEGPRQEGRELREREPGGGASESESDKPKSSSREARTAWAPVQLLRVAVARRLKSLQSHRSQARRFAGARVRWGP
ncbi:hypothetical protein H8959_011905 [Pygathrix nigripes]